MNWGLRSQVTELQVYSIELQSCFSNRKQARFSRQLVPSQLVPIGDRSEPTGFSSCSTVVT